MTGQLAGGGNLERRNETDRRRNLVGGQALVADLKDLALEVRTPPPAPLGSGSPFKTTSAATSEPVIGLFLDRTIDMRTAGCRLIAASTSSG